MQLNFSYGCGKGHGVTPHRTGNGAVLACAC